MSGHGTRTMGVMVGRDAGGSGVGVAPDAQWIAVKIFDDAGSATVAGIHAGFQWLLDPDGNPATADAPHVVNNSWTFSGAGCNLRVPARPPGASRGRHHPGLRGGELRPAGLVQPEPGQQPGGAGRRSDDQDRWRSGRYSSRGPTELRGHRHDLSRGRRPRGQHPDDRSLRRVRDGVGNVARCPARDGSARAPARRACRGDGGAAGDRARVLRRRSRRRRPGQHVRLRPPRRARGPRLARARRRPTSRSRSPRRRRARPRAAA